MSDSLCLEGFVRKHFLDVKIYTTFAKPVKYFEMLGPASDSLTEDLKYQLEMNKIIISVNVIQTSTERLIVIAGASIAVQKGDILLWIGFAKMMASLYLIMSRFSVMDHFPYEVVQEILPIARQLIDGKARFEVFGGTRMMLIYSNAKGKPSFEEREVDPLERNSKLEAQMMWVASVNNPWPGYCLVNQPLPKVEQLSITCDQFEAFFPTKVYKYLGLIMTHMHSGCGKNCRSAECFDNPLYQRTLGEWIKRRRDKEALYTCDDGCPMDMEEMRPISDFPEEYEEEGQIFLPDMFETLLTMDPITPHIEYFESEIGSLKQIIAVNENSGEMFVGLSKTKESAEQIVNKKIVQSYAGLHEVTPLQVIKGGLLALQETTLVEVETPIPYVESTCLLNKNDKHLMLETRNGNSFSLPRVTRNVLEPSDRVLSQESNEMPVRALIYEAGFRTRGTAVYHYKSGEVVGDKTYMAPLKKLPMMLEPLAYRVLFRHKWGCEWPWQIDALLESYQKKRFNFRKAEGPYILNGVIQLLSRVLEREEREEINKGVKYKIIRNRFTEFEGKKLDPYSTPLLIDHVKTKVKKQEKG
jgi:hypothetical protein